MRPGLEGRRTRLEEHDIDEMSEMSFPASDPPSTSPITNGPVPPDQDQRV